jgi:hypothetical protein
VGCYLHHAHGRFPGGIRRVIGLPILRSTKGVNIDRPSALDLNGLYLHILNNHVLTLGDLIAAHHVVPRNDLASFGIDVLLLQAVARLPIDAIEAHFFAERRGG